MGPIVVGFDAQTLTGSIQTGLGVYSRCLSDSLRKHPEALELRLLWPRGRKRFRRTLERLVWEQYYLVFEALKNEVHLLHSPAFSVPRFTAIPTVVTAHDLIVFKHPELLPSGSRWYFGRWIPSSYRHADHIIAVSHSTKNDLVNLLHIDPERITVIHHGVSGIYTRTTDPHELNRVRHMYRVPMEFFLMVGSFEPRKNVLLAIDAFSRISKSSPQLKLLLAGSPNRYQRKVAEVVKELEMEEKVIFAGYVADRELVTLYSAATALVFPSSAEGFGLPIVEAMAVGCPVIASDLDVLREVGGDAPVYVPVGDPVALSEAMLRMLEDRRHRAECVRKGLGRSVIFDWDRAAKETYKVYLKVLKKRGKL